MLWNMCAERKMRDRVDFEKNSRPNEKQVIYLTCIHQQRNKIKIEFIF